MAGFAHRPCEWRDPMIEPQHCPNLSCPTSVSPLATASSAPILPVLPTPGSVRWPLHTVFQGGAQQPDRFISPERGVVQGCAEWLVLLQLKQVPEFGVPS